MRATSRSRIGGAGLALVLLALIARLIVPQGTMISHDARGPELVICTGHGAMTTPDGPKAPAKSRTSGECAFAGHAGSAPLAATGIGVGVPIAWTAPVRDPAPIRSPPPPLGLAAPPPPPLGPPTVLG